MKLDFVEMCLNADGDGVFKVLLGQTFASSSLADFARLKREKKSLELTTYKVLIFVGTYNFGDFCVFWSNSRNF